jgi:hypothetical protein
MQPSKIKKTPQYVFMVYCLSTGTNFIFTSFFSFWSEVQTSPLLLRRQLACCGRPGQWRIVMSVEQSMEWFSKENRRTQRKPAPVPLFSTINITWQSSSSNPGQCGGKQATNRLIYGTAFTFTYIYTPLRWDSKIRPWVLRDFDLLWQGPEAIIQY